MERYKTEILTVEGFLEERPDMEVHTDKTIQSAIYQVAGMLNAKTGGLIQKVWDYSVVDRTNNGSDNGFTQPDPNCVYFRTPEQLAFIKQAFVEQTQYNINLGNDYTQGGGSYSIGNVNSSYSKPVNFDTFAPMVEYLLQQARVLDLQSFLNESSTIKNSGECISPELEYDCKCLTENYADKTYLKIYQPDADEGRIATINNAHIITFEPISNLNVCAKSVYDPIEQVCKQINQFGVEYFGGLTKQQIYDAIYAAGVVWSPLITYKKDFIVMFQLNDGSGFYKYAKSLIDDNINNNPNDSPKSWEILPIEPVELQQMYDYIDKKFSELPEVNLISEGDGEIIQFNSLSDYEQYKQTMGVDDSYFENVNDNVAYVNQTNTFTRPQIFDSGISVINGTISIGVSPNQDEDVVNLAYFNQFATEPIQETNEHINLLESALSSLSSKVDNNQTNITNLIGTQQETILANVFVSFLKKIYSASGGTVGGTNGAFYTIFTNLTINDNWEHKIKTSGDIGNPNGPQWFSSLQISTYINSQNKLVICLNKLYDSNDDLDYWKNNIKIITWRKNV